MAISCIFGVIYDGPALVPPPPAAPPSQRTQPSEPAPGAALPCHKVGELYIWCDTWL